MKNHILQETKFTQKRKRSRKKELALIMALIFAMTSLPSLITGGSVTVEAETIEGGIETAGAAAMIAASTEEAAQSSTVVAESNTAVAEPVEATNSAETGTGITGIEWETVPYASAESESVTVTLTYEATEGGSVDRETEVVTITGDTVDALGATATADADYTFLGWQDEYGNTLRQDLTFVPNAGNINGRDRTFTAVFEPATKTLRNLREEKAASAESSENKVTGGGQ